MPKLAGRESQQAWAHGAVFPFQGQPLRVCLDNSARAACVTADELILPLPADATASRIRDQVHAWLQGEAQRILPERIQHCAHRAALPTPNWTFTFSKGLLAGLDQGQLRLHWRLIELSPQDIDAAITRALQTAQPPQPSAGLFDDLPA